MKIGFSLHRMDRPDLDVLYRAADFDDSFEHPLHGICKLRDSNFAMRHIPRKTICKPK
jgi:hypothetical protein